MGKQKLPASVAGKRQLSVSEQVLASVEPPKFGYASWCDKLPDQLRAEFEQARLDWDRTKIRQSSYARAVIEVARQRGVEALPTYDTVCRWLRSRKA